MEDEKKLIKKALIAFNIKAIESLYKSNKNFLIKSSKKSIIAREKGNKLYVKKSHSSQEHEQILKYYACSIVEAPIESEDLALGYGNRSALLQHLQKFEDSISDINRALKITKSLLLKIKLLCRKTVCLSSLKKLENDDDLKVAEELLNNVQDKKEFKIAASVIDKTKTFIKSNTSNIFEKEHIETDHTVNNNDQNEKTEIQKIFSKKKKENPFETVFLKYSNIYGRHLVANRDIKPGEIIMITKPLICANLNSLHIFCSHCLKTSWASIPCDYCNKSMYCSEECKIEAYQKYHDIECPIVPFILKQNSEDLDESSISGLAYWRMALRVVIPAIRKYGNLSKLKTELRKIDRCEDKIHKGFLNGKFCETQIESLYSLSDNVLSSHLGPLSNQAIVLAVLAMYLTSLFGEKVEFVNSKDLLSNEDVLFFCTLLLKFMKINVVNALSVSEGGSPCRFAKNGDDCERESCCERGTSLSTTASLINHSCYPNVRKCFTEDMHVLLYALRPISKNSQLFDSYGVQFYTSPKSRRDAFLEDYNFKCCCLPCKENWPTVSLKNQLFVNTPDFGTWNVYDVKLYKKYRSILMSKNVHNYYNRRTIEDLVKEIESHLKYNFKPSYVAAVLITSLTHLFDNTFGIKFKVPEICFNY